MGLLNLPWRLGGRSMCAARLHCLKKWICRKKSLFVVWRNFYDLRTFVFWQECFQAWFSFMSNEERGGKKKLPSFCNIFQMREMNSCKYFSNQVVEVNQQKASQVLWRMLSSTVSAINHREHKRDQSATTIQKWLFEKSEKSVAPSIIFLWNLIGHHLVLGLNNHFSESCVFLVFLLIWNQEMFDIFIFDKIFWSISNMQNLKFIIFEN